MKNNIDWNKFNRQMHQKHLEQLRLKFGKDLKKPVPEDFGLTYEVIEEIKEILKYNRKTYTSLLHFFRPTKDHGLFPNYWKWEEKMEKHPSYPDDKELKILLEEEAILEENRKKSEYWFNLDGFEFEEEIANLFQKTGLFDALRTKGTGDGGIDIILTKPDGNKIFVQCKAHKKAVSPHVARDLFGAMTASGVNEGLIISLGGISNATREFMDGKNIRAIDVEGVIKLQERKPDL